MPRVTPFHSCAKPAISVLAYLERYGEALIMRREASTGYYTCNTMPTTLVSHGVRAGF